MITLLQPNLGAGLIELGNADPTVKLLQKQVAARHAAVVPTGSFVVGDSTISVDSLVQAALEASPAYGLFSNLTASEVTDHYSAAEQIMRQYYGLEKPTVPATAVDA
ncbi:MAG: hypothetical protein WAX89_07895 [Alphaproteobacteria bacterium]